MVVKITELDNGYEVEINGVPLYVFSGLAENVIVPRLAAALEIPESSFVRQKLIRGEITNEGRYWPS